MTASVGWFAGALLTVVGAAADVNRLGWLSGDWQGCLGAMRVEEHWGPPAAGTLLGTGRNRLGEQLKLFEFLRIYQGPEGLIFAPQPRGEQSVTFAVHSIGDQAVEFRNAAHDFPQFVGYRLDADGALQISVGVLDSAPEKVLRYRLYRVGRPEAGLDCASP